MEIVIASSPGPASTSFHQMQAMNGVHETILRMDVGETILRMDREVWAVISYRQRWAVKGCIQGHFTCGLRRKVARWGTGSARHREKTQHSGDYCIARQYLPCQPVGTAVTVVSTGLLGLRLPIYLVIVEVISQTAIGRGKGRCAHRFLSSLPSPGPSPNCLQHASTSCIVGPRPVRR